MKCLHRPDLYAWSLFDEARNIDFNATLWRRPEGNVAIDPLALSNHDLAHVVALGGIASIVITNADHIRATADLSRRFSATIAAPIAERALADYAGFEVDRWLVDEEVFEGLRCLQMRGSKTAGELCLLLPDQETVITGDLVRGQRAGALNLLPDAKLVDKRAAVESLGRLCALPGLRNVVVGDGFGAFGNGDALLADLHGRLCGA